MISVIMPTIWKGKQYKTMLPLFNQHPLIDDIVIIDNKNKDCDTSLFELEKISFCVSDKNLYVNKSWNMGVKKAYYNKLCFYSDDVLFDFKVIDAVYQHISEDTGMIGFSEESILDAYEEQALMGYYSDIEVATCNVMPYGYASTFFLHKNNYHAIPKEFQIYFGDTFLFHMNKKLGKRNLVVNNFEVRTNMGTTSKAFKRMTEKEWAIAEEVLGKYGITKEEWLPNGAE